MPFTPSSLSYGAPRVTSPRGRKTEERKLRAAIRRTAGRIKRERREIRDEKRRIAVQVSHGQHNRASAQRLHGYEFALHRDRHMLAVLQAHLRDLGRHGSLAPVAAALDAERRANAGDMQPSVPGYPPPPTAPPAEKSPAQAASEAAAEAADPAAADAHDHEVAQAAEGEDHDASVSGEVGVDTNVPLLKNPWFWGAAGVGGLLYWKRADIAKMMPKGA